MKYNGQFSHVKCNYTRAVRKVRGQVPIFLKKNNVFFKNVSDTCIP